MTEDRLMFFYAKVVERPLTMAERDELFDHFKQLAALKEQVRLMNVTKKEQK